MKGYLKRNEKHILVPEATFLPDVKKRYEPIFNKIAYHLTLMGATDVMLAQAFNVSLESIKKWKRDHPDFLEALKRGKMIADGEVAYSLYRSATGYKYKDKVVMANKVKKFVDGKVVKEYTEPLIVDVEREMPPNANAAIKWLTARQPDKWGHKVSIKGNLTVNNNANFDFSGLTIQELEVLSKIGLKANNGVENAEHEEIDSDE